MNRIAGLFLLPLLFIIVMIMVQDWKAYARSRQGEVVLATTPIP